MAERTDLNTTWTYLSAESKSGLRANPLKVETERGPIRAGLDDEGRRHLLIPVGDIDSVREDTSSTGVVLTGRRLVEDGILLDFADVCVTAESSNELFGYVASEIVDKIEESSQEPVFAALSSLDLSLIHI